MLVARLAEMEGDEGRSREWTTRALHARRDPAWTADGVVSDRWMPVSPASGRLDAFQWRAPLAEIGGHVIESGGTPAAIEAPPTVPPAPKPATSAPAPLPGSSAPELPQAEAPPADAGSVRPSPAAPAFGGVVPLVHAPDDPGPAAEPPAEPTADAPAPATNGWDRLRALFRGGSI
jgi:HemY protein